jgi:gas vesicle protein
MDKDYTVSLGIGLIAGAAIGFAVGFLFAPDSGKETRHKIREKVSGLVESAHEHTAGISYKGEQKISPYDQ